MKAVNPYVNFKGNTEEAFNFYQSVFGGEFLGVVRFRDFPDNSMGVPEADLDKIAHIALPLGPHNILMGTDAVDSMPKDFVPGNNVSMAIETESADEADRLFNGLSSGGEVEMPLTKTDWAEKYGSCTDKFGVQWMVNYTGNVDYAAAAAASDTSKA